MTEGVLTGVDGKVELGASDFADVTGWNAALTANVKEYGSSGNAQDSSSGHTLTAVGRKAGTLNFTVKNDTRDPLWDRIKVGDQVTLNAYENATRKWVFPCRINNMEPTVDVEDTEINEISCAAILHGPWTYPDGTQSS